MSREQSKAARHDRTEARLARADRLNTLLLWAMVALFLLPFVLVAVL